MPATHARLTKATPNLRQRQDPLVIRVAQPPPRAFNRKDRAAAAGVDIA
ncbi:hypothetical protein CHELA20_40138 [Hyphomicrobiales bacterium]|nr:hypothetical protein CHELA20_40138 [Hyphomicrobiales bacterium]CAH1687038.1 hypothetical protein CHELA41_30096 [Hyphomicrobiales bacterium]